jgi:serine protease inhibitor
MGIRNLFTNEADLSGMSSSSRSAMLKVSNIYHQSSIEVNEGGSVASAASGYMSEKDSFIFHMINKSVIKCFRI